MFNTLYTATTQNLSEIYRCRSFRVDPTGSHTVTGQCGSSLTVSRLYRTMRNQAIGGCFMFLHVWH